MNRLASIRPSVASTILAAAAVAVVAAPQKPGLPGGKMLLENDRIVVVEGIVAPGDVNRMHKHELRSVVVCIEGATIKETLPDGRTRTYGRKPGDVAWRDAGLLHEELNVGETRLRVIAVQLK